MKRSETTMPMPYDVAGDVKGPPEALVGSSLDDCQQALPSVRQAIM